MDVIRQIHDDSNPITLNQAETSTSSKAALFDGPLAIVSQVDRTTMGGNIDTCINQVEPISMMASEGVTETIALTCTSTVPLIHQF